MARLYGYLTKKDEGSDWILLPASKAEKFVSMLIQALIVVPVGVLGVFLCTDWLLCLVDHGCGQSLIAGYFSMAEEFGGGEAAEAMSIMGLSTFGFLVLSIIGCFVNYLFFVLCGICFKKNKIVFAFLILFGLSVVLSTLSALIVPLLNYDGFINIDDAAAAQLVKGMVTWMYVLFILIALGLGWGVWRRISTIKH